jgi:signal transduction histidine kinase
MPQFLEPPDIQEGDSITGVLLRLAETIGFHTRPETLLPVVVELVADVVCCESCLLSLWDDHSASFHPTAAFGLTPELERFFFDSPVGPDDIPLIDEIKKRRLPVIAAVDDPLVPEAVRRFAAAASALSTADSELCFLVMPLLHHDQWIGGMLVITERTCLGKNELAVVTGIAQQTALAIASARAFEQERRRRRDLETLQETIALFSSELQLPALYRHIVERAALTFSAPAAALFTWDKNVTAVKPAATFGLSDTFAETARLAPSLLLRALQTSKDLSPIAIADLERTPLLQPDLVQAEGLMAALLVPLQRGDRIMGLIQVYQRVEGVVFDKDAMALAKALANQAVTALDNAQLCTALQTEQDRLRALSSRLTQAQEAERTRIARELHDEAGQALTTVRLQLDYLESALPEDLPLNLRRQVSEARTLVGQTLEEIRRISIDLRPSLLDDLGLAPALRWQCDRLSRRSKLKVSFVSKQATRRLAPHIETAVYRAAQEALTNISRHAEATSVDVILDYRHSRLHLTITDDGKGFSNTADQTLGLGLMGMRERLSAVRGSVHIDSQPDIGSTLFIEVPL